MSDLLPWTSEQILALAADPQVARAAGPLARPGKWRNLGRSNQAVWGEHQGSGTDAYRVAVDLGGPSLKCTCPSRKRPCKHVIALLLLAHNEPARLPAAAVPPWVAEWLLEGAKRTAGPPAKKVDSRAQSKRATQRQQRVDQGVEALALWLEDLVRQGLAGLAGRPASFWEEQAARLVDAQAPELGRRVRELAVLPASGEGWPARMLDRLGRLHLLLEAYRRLDRLPPDLQEEVRSQVGWTQDQEALRALPGVQDRWAVVGRRVTEEDRLRVQHTWLWGLSGRSPALVLDYAVGARSFGSNLVPGTALEGELVFWPGPLPLRALVQSQRAAPLDALPGYPSLEAGLAAYAEAVGRNPWLERLLLPLEGVLPVRDGERWAVCDAGGHSLPLTMPPGEGWRLLALSGGYPVTLVAEWDGECLYPLGVWTGHEYALLGAEP